MHWVVFLDVDNTLIDNDRARDDLWRATDRVLGEERSRAFWTAYEEVRGDRGYVDFLETLRRFHGTDGSSPDALDRAILDFPYADYRYPDSLRVIEALRAHGTVVILSDGDAVFQPLKIARAGLAEAVDGNVVVFPHKDRHLDDLARLFPADRYIAVDDKAEVLARIKLQWVDRVKTVHVVQGKYSDDPYEGPPPDVVVPRIGDIADDMRGTAVRSSLFDDEKPPTGGARGG